MTSTDPATGVVLDASAMVDLLTNQRARGRIRRRLRDTGIHVPAHFDAEVLSALGRLCRAGDLTTDDASDLIRALRRAPFSRHLLPGLIEGRGCDATATDSLTCSTSNWLNSFAHR